MMIFVKYDLENPLITSAEGIEFFLGKISGVYFFG